MTPDKQSNGRPIEVESYPVHERVKTELGESNDDDDDDDENAS